MSTNFYVVISGRIKLEDAGTSSIKKVENKLLVEGEWFGHDLYILAAVTARQLLKD